MAGRGSDLPVASEDRKSPGGDDVNEWYEALGGRNCERILKLLEHYPSLLKVGWRVDLSRDPLGNRTTRSPNRSPYRGRTALHVGVQEQCVDLIVQVLQLFRLEDDVRIFHSSRRGQSDAATPSPSNLPESEGTESVRIDAARPGPSDLPESEGIESERIESERIESVDTPFKSDDFSREDLRNLLLAKDGDTQQVALAMAATQYNVEAIILLIYAYGQVENSLGITKSTLTPKFLDQDESSSHSEEMAKLRSAAKDFIKDMEKKKSWDTSTRDFPEYIFHNMVADRNFSRAADMDWLSSFWRQVRFLGGFVWRFLLELQNEQGRTPFQVAMRQGKAFAFLDSLTSGEDDKAEVVICALTAPDRAGRTPAHLAAVAGDVDVIGLLLEYSGHGYEQVSATLRARWRHPCYGDSAREVRWGLTQKHSRWRILSNWKHISMYLANLSKEAGFRENHHGHNPLHAAIMHRNYEVARRLIANAGDIPYCQDAQMEHWPFLGKWIQWDIVAFACYVGYGKKGQLPQNFTNFLRESSNKLKESRRSSKKRDFEERMGNDGEEYIVVKMPWKALHVIASRGDYRLLKWFLDNAFGDPKIEDHQGNTALHYALELKDFGEFQTHLLDYVDLPEELPEELRSEEHLQAAQNKEKQDNLQRAAAKEKQDELQRLSERQRCIDLLLLAGCDAFKENETKEIPYPQGSLENPRFLSWWFDRREMELTAAQTSLNSSITAISVTATLIATASYVGPLQPPLGLATDDQIQYENGWVATFIFCNTLSFHCAILALVYSLLSFLSTSFPILRGPMSVELRRTRGMVSMALITLCPAILGILVAFVASSMAVVSADKTSSLGGKLTIAPLSICGPCTLGALFTLSVRLLGIIFPRDRAVRKLYKHTSLEFE